MYLRPLERKCLLRTRKIGGGGFIDDDDDEEEEEEEPLRGGVGVGAVDIGGMGSPNNVFRTSESYDPCVGGVCTSSPGMGGGGGVVGTRMGDIDGRGRIRECRIGDGVASILRSTLISGDRMDNRVSSGGMGEVAAGGGGSGRAGVRMALISSSVSESE